jgi:2-polyprenyl-6-methoxyphenol hydroxylase-like FAD-dependent oxidoreductase
VGEVQLTDGGAGASADTRFPFILFVSQAETESVLAGHLAANGFSVERGVELTTFRAEAETVACTLRHGDGREEQVHARYLIGCDGAHSTVRRTAGIPFEGGEYLEDFVLGDVEINGPIAPDALHSFVGERGFTMSFPLGNPTTWRVIAMAPAHPSSAASPNAASAPALSLDELQSFVDGATGGALRLHDAAWLTHFRLHHRQTAHYRAGRVFLAGDAAHIHSPVGAQGMNTGIQDAWNLGWKLATVLRGVATDALLDTYEAERWPVGRFLLRVTDRVFGGFVRMITPGRVVRFAQRHVVPHVLPRVVASPRLRAAAFRFVSELGIRYRKSAAVVEGHPRLARGPRAGDRLPDLAVQAAGTPTSLHRLVDARALDLLLCGATRRWDACAIRDVTARLGDAIRVRHLGPDGADPAVGDGHVVDTHVLHTLGVDDRAATAQYLVRPDGYIAFRCAGDDLTALDTYLRRWYPGAA